MFFSHFNIIVSYVFPENFIKNHQVSQNISNFTSSILTIFVNFLGVFNFIWYKKLMTSVYIRSYNRFFDLELFLIGCLRFVLSYMNIELALLAVLRLRWSHWSTYNKLLSKSQVLEPCSWNNIKKTQSFPEEPTIAHLKLFHNFIIKLWKWRILKFPQRLKEFIASWLYRNLCSLRWLKPTHSIIKSFIPFALCTLNMLFALVLLKRSRCFRNKA